MSKMAGYIFAFVLFCVCSLAYDVSHLPDERLNLQGGQQQEVLAPDDRTFHSSDHKPSRRQPNIIFILTDDQDSKLGSLDYMPNVQKSLVAEGISVDNHFATVAQCCPSRASLFRGQAAHNTNNTHVMAPGYAV